MRIEPRKQILDIWGSLLRTSYDETKQTWRWASGEDPNSISDAEQLLCLLHPMTEIEAFALHDPDRIKSDSDVDRILRSSFRARSRIPAAILDICADYFARHTRADGQPSFTSGSYLFPSDTEGDPATDKQRDSIEVVDAYSISITLCLAVLFFTKARTELPGSAASLAKVRALDEAANRRLTAAMIGLVRCFVVNSIYVDDAAGRTLLDALGHTSPELSAHGLVDKFDDRLMRTRSRLRSNVSMAIPDHAMPDDEQLFEIGWTWGVAREAGPIDFVEHFAIAASEGSADSRPYLYFTVVALDGIVDLFSPRVRELDLFDEVQTRLVDALRVRWELTQRYWSALARFNPDYWPLEDLPWRASDGEESDYYSLLVASILIKDFDDRAPTASDLAKTVGILSDLAGRAKITRRLTRGDPALLLHWPGVWMRLIGSEDEGPQLAWCAYDFTPVLLKRACQAMQLSLDVNARENLMRLAESAMDQLELRRLKTGPAAGLWDDPSGVDFDSYTTHTETPSWYFTERVVQALVWAAAAYDDDPPRSDAMNAHLLALLGEADHLYNQQLMATDTGDMSRRRTDLETIGMLIDRARGLDRAQSGTAVALAMQALVMLNGLQQARWDARRGG